MKKAKIDFKTFVKLKRNGVGFQLYDITVDFPRQVKNDSGVVIDLDQFEYDEDELFVPYNNIDSIVYWDETEGGNENGTKRI